MDPPWCDTAGGSGRRGVDRALVLLYYAGAALPDVVLDESSGVDPGRAGGASRPFAFMALARLAPSAR